MITIIDYGAGNLQSVKNALDFIGAENRISASAEEILAADAVILPGVGSFGDAMACLQQSGLCDTVRQAALSDKPFLGICLGLHMLFEYSQESAGVEGLGVLKGGVKRFPDSIGLKIPHIGWNSADTVQDCPLYAGLDAHNYVYFVHSYYLCAQEEDVVATTTDYGIRFHSSIAVPQKKLYATQFHPEKSGSTGLRILRNFVAMQGED